MEEHQTISVESEAGFRALFQFATVGIVVISADGNIQLANPCIEKLFGYSNAELLGHPIETLIPESLRKAHISHREGYFKNPKARAMGHGLNLHARKKDNSEFPVEISLGHYLLGRERLAVAFVTDISNQVEAKKIIEDREALFRNMANDAPVMIWVSGSDKQYTYFNNTWLKFTGRTLEQELGSGWMEGVHPEDLKKCIEIYTKSFDARDSFSMQFRLRRKDGQYRWIEVVGKPVYSDENFFYGYFGACSDIHLQKMTKEDLEARIKERTLELTASLESEKRLNEMKSRFVSMASHEFRTPLSGILTSVSLLKSYNKDGQEEKRHKHIDRIKSSVNNLVAILNNFLSLDKLEQGKVEMIKESFDLQLFSEDLLEELNGILKKGQQINFTHAGTKEIVQDKRILRNVLLNLLSNAIKYSEEDKQIDLMMNVSDSIVSIKVKDEGIGIPEEEQANLFGKFYRARNAVNIQGTGLGLNIVKKYVELLNGSIHFESSPGKGTVFNIEFPQNIEE